MKQQAAIFVSARQRYAIYGFLFGLLFPIGSTIVRILSAGLPLTTTSAIQIQSNDALLWIIDTAPLFLGIFAWLAGYRQDMLQKVNSDLVNTEKELKHFQATLEQRVEERTRELTAANQKAEKRTSQMRAIAEIARTVITVRNMDELLQQLTRLISEELGFYHVGIFLLDKNREFAVLQAANSVGGAKMLARRHRLQVGQQGIVGYVTAQGIARIALDVGVEAVYFNNPDLPETHSEVALPLKFGQEIIGALDIQSTQVNAFSHEDVELFTILADQVSVAIQNARSLEQAQRAVREAEIASRRLAGQQWKGYVEGIKTRGYRYDGVKPEPVIRSTRTSEEQDAFTVPVQLRGETIGRLKLKRPDSNRQWTDDELAIIESTAERVAIAMDGARLLDEAQKRASREAFLSDLAAKLGTSFQIDSILRDTVEELGHAIKGTTVTFQLVNPAAPTQQDPDQPSPRKKAE